MFRSFFRWIFRTVIVVVVLVAIVAISEHISHRVAPNSILSVELDGTVVERGGTSVLGLLSKNQTALNVLRNALDRGATNPKSSASKSRSSTPRWNLRRRRRLSR